MRPALLLSSVVAAVSASVIPGSGGSLTAIKTVNGRAVTVTAQDLANFKFFAQYAGSAYCNEDAAAGAIVTCANSVCPAVTANGAKVLLSLDGDTGTNMDGFVGVDPVRKLIVVSLRGSSSIRNWISNLLFLFSSCSGDLVSGCKVHTGFLESWRQIQADVVATVAAAKRANPSYAVVATGHSLGGAVATIAAAYLRKAGYAADIYTYGSPRVGNQEFAAFVSGQAGAEYRVTHLDDTVTRLPPLFLGYRHTTPEYWLSTGTSTTTNYGLSDIKVCEGYANIDCAGSGGDLLDIDAHLYYFQAIAGCSDGLEIRDEAATLSDDELRQRLATYVQMDQEYAAALAADGSTVV